MKKIISFFSALFFTILQLLGQARDVPHPDDTRFGIDSPFDIILFLVIPVIIIIGYILYLRKKKKDKAEEEEENKED